jgi:hypothetical protein
MSEAWVTDEDLSAARLRFAAGIPGFVMPVAYGVARLDQDGPTFGHVNTLGAVRPIPAVVLASVCGYVASTATYRLDREGFERAAALLAPAEAATHVVHLNLWSWRELLDGGTPDSEFLAFFLADAEDPPVDAHDEQFRRLIGA